MLLMIGAMAVVILSKSQETNQQVKLPEAKVGGIWFDDVVVEKESIGPIQLKN